MAIDANYISQLEADTPQGPDQAGEGDDYLRELKRVLQMQFTGFTSPIACTPTIAQLNQLTGLSTSAGTIEERLSALEGKTLINPLPVEAYDFTDDWWAEPSRDQPGRIYSARVANGDLVKQPWDTTVVAHYQLVVQRWVNDSYQCALNLVWRRDEDLGLSILFYRQASAAAGLPSAPWMRATFAQINSTTNQGNIEYSSVCPEKEARCP